MKRQDISLTILLPIALPLMLAWQTIAYAATIQGVVFNDLNNNGVQDTCEPGLDNITVYIQNHTQQDAGQGGFYSTNTQADGAYSSSPHSPGNFTIWSDLPNGWHQTAPDQNEDSVIPYPFTITNNNDTISQNFGLRDPNAAIQECSFSCDTVTEIPTAQCETLVSLYDSTDGENWLKNTGWKQTNTPCSWYGVTCVETDQIGAILLNDNNLNGTLPDLSELTHLQTLYLNNNQLTGSLPDFTELTNLANIHLQNNQFTGAIPDLNGLIHLQSLFLDNNQLTGSIPDLTDLADLLIISLHDNQLTGSIPDFSGLTNLQVLNLSNNTELCKNPNTDYSKWAGTVSSFPACQVNFCDTVTQIPKAQCETLADLYETTNGSDWTNNTDWLQTNTPCSWYGITCGNSLVTEIDLHDNNLNGTLPELSALTSLEILALHTPLENSITPNNLTGNIPDLSGLTHLKTLHLGGNQLSGTIPDLSALTQLQSLVLFKNKLNGPIPESIKILTNLISLYLNENELSGTIPELSALTQLRNLVLASNNLSGPIPESISTLTNLKTLHLAANQLTGPIPDLSALNQLESIGLHENQLTGPIPNLAGLSQLWYLALDANQLSGAIPASIGTLTNLKTLHLAANQLTGPIPDLSALNQLESIGLHENQLTGPIPNLAGLSQLWYLALDANQLSGAIPASIGTLTNLQELYLGGNQFTGAIPDLSQLKKLRILHLHLNKLTGSIPAFMGTLTDLEKLALAGNQLTGSVPDLSALKELKKLYLNLNQLTGPIPDLSDLNNLEELRLQDNQFTGPIPDFSPLTNLSQLELSGNTALCKNPNTDYGNWTTTVSSFADCQVSFCDTVTEIPKAQCETLVALYDSTDGDNWKNNTGWKQTNMPCSWYGVNCSNGVVTSLNLSDNKLTGTLPEEIGALTGLNYLRLDNNNLSGTLPTTLSALTHLQWLFINNNALTGTIPDLSALTNLEQFQMIGNQLSGGFPASLTGLTKLTQIGLSNNQLTGSIPDLSALTKLNALYLSNNQLTGPLPDLSALTALQHLYVYDNQLTGSLPDFSQLTNLTELRVRGNKFSGPIPALNTLTNLEAVELHSNSELCQDANVDYGTLDMSAFPTCEFLDLFWLDSYAPESPAETTGNVVLENGVSYLVQVTGSISVWRPDWENEGYCGTPENSPLYPSPNQQDRAVGLDYEYGFAGKAGETWICGGDMPMDRSDGRMSVDGGNTWFTPTPLDSAYNPEHIYTYRVTGQGHALKLQFTDPSPGDNYGQFEIQVSPPTTDCAVVTEIPQTECEALVTFYDSLGGNNWTNKTGWKQTNTPCNGWYNVACKDGHVSHIHLEENNLVGTIPDLSALTELEALAIGKNAGITGAFPDISQLSKLFHLSVGATNLSGSLPANIVDASQLRELGVGETKLSGELPDFSQLSNLQVLDLNHCQFSGQIPALPTSLTLLNLAGNNLSGSIPALTGLSNLQTLWLSENKFTGSIPELTSLTQLQQAYFSHNQLTGSVPSLAGLTELIGFSISRNQLTGPIPELSHLTKLEKIWLDNNDLSGPIPEVSMLTNLQLFTLDGNTKLEGPIPSLPANVETLTLGGELCQNPNADYAGHSEVDAFEICPDVKFIAETSTVEACIGQNLTVTVKKQLAQTVNQIQLALSYDANLLRINTISNAGPLSQFNANHANGSATIEAGNFTGVSDEFKVATLQLVPLAASVGTALQFEESQTLVKLNGASLRYEAQGVTVAIKNCVSEIEVKPEENSSIWTLVDETEAVEQTGANLDAPKSISFDASGNTYIADSLNHRILKRDAQGQLSVVAGNGKRGFAGDDGPAIEAKLNSPQGTAVDEEGNLYIADTNNHRIRKVDSNGIITTVVGNGKRGFAGDDGLALKAKLREPTAIVFDNNGHLYIADSGNHRIRKVSGQRTRKPGADSVITTFAGDGRRSYRGDNGPATQARLNNPSGLAVDSQNNVYIADTDNHRVRKVDNRGIISTVAGTGDNGYSGDGDPAIAAKLNAPTGLEVDTEGNLYIADKNNHRVRKVNNEGIITTFTGTGKRGTSTDGILAGVAQINQPTDVALDQYGNLYVADKGNDTIRKIGEKEGEGPIARPHEIADCANTETTGIPESECYALIALYDSTNGPDWTDNQGWKATDTPCQWTGITCQDGHVSEINLANNNLVGDLPPQIGALVNLTHLNLNDNQVSGAIPTTIEHLNNLETLNLANNKLSGSLPVELSGATGLQTVNLADNQISGEIPDLAPLTQLETLDLQNNLLSGEVPDLTVLPALQTFKIGGENQQLCKNSETDYGNLPVEGLDTCPTDNQLPTAAFSTTPNKGEAPLTVQLDARISHDPYGNITAYFWETSDEQILTGATPTITFNKSGTYEIKLRVMDHDGAPSINVAKQLIEVSPAPDQMTLSLDKDGTGLGTVRLQRDKDPAITCKTDCQTESQDYPLGSEIKLTATAAKGSLFTGWQGDCVGTEVDRRIKLTMDSAKQCTAVFELESPIPSTMHALTIDSVAAEFNSGGSVMVNDLPCETPPCKSYHQRNKNVKITGIPIPHAYFMSWNNDCPVLGTFQDATNLVTLTSDTTCIAYFGNDSVPASEQIAQQFEEVAELSTGESVTEMYPELDNRERYELAFLVAEKAMMTAETQMIIPGEESWPDQFDEVEDFFKLPDNLWVKKVRIVSTEEDIGQFHVQGQYVRVDVLLINKNGGEDLVPVLIYYKDKPTVEQIAPLPPEEIAPPPPVEKANETKRGLRYRWRRRRPIFFRRW